MSHEQSSSLTMIIDDNLLHSTTTCKLILRRVAPKPTEAILSAPLTPCSSPPRNTQLCVALPAQLPSLSSSQWHH